MYKMIHQVILRCWKCRSDLKPIGVNGVTHYFCDKCRITYEMVSKFDPVEGDIREYIVPL